MSSDEDLLNERDSEAEDNSKEDKTEEVTKDEEGEEQKKVVKPKRVIRNPQPKLNVETLKGKTNRFAFMY